MHSHVGARVEATVSAYELGGELGDLPYSCEQGLEDEASLISSRSILVARPYGGLSCAIYSPMDS